MHKKTITTPETPQETLIYKGDSRTGTEKETLQDSKIIKATLSQKYTAGKQQQQQQETVRINKRRQEIR